MYPKRWDDRDHVSSREVRSPQADNDIDNDLALSERLGESTTCIITCCQIRITCIKGLHVCSVVSCAVQCSVVSCVVWCSVVCSVVWCRV